MTSLRSHNPEFEAARILALEELEIIGSPREKEFDQLVELVAEICRVPVVILSFVDGERQWLKSKVGTELSEMDPSRSVCRETIMNEGLNVVPDLLGERIFTPEVVPPGAAIARFYAGVPIHAPGGQRVGTLAIFDSKPRDLTEREGKTLTAIGEQIDFLLKFRSQAKARILIERGLEIKRLAIMSMREGVLVQDSKGAVVDYNRAALDMLGISADDLIQKTYDKPKWRAVNVDKETLASHDHPSAVTLRTGQPQLNIIMGICRSNNDICWLKVNSVPLFIDEKNRLSHTVTSFANITEIVKLEDKIENAARLSALGEMSGSIAHEINSPLAVVQGKVEQFRDRLAGEGFNPEKDLHECDKILSTVSRIAKVITGLKSYSRNAAADEFESAEIEEILGETLELCNDRYKLKGVRLVVESVDEAFIECRAAQISQVLLNLLGNALDAVSELPEKWVKVKVCRDGDFVEVCITDSGRGIPDEIVGKMMHSYFTTKGIGRGTGLGLSISQIIVAKHGGTLAYFLNEGHTAFRLRLPLSKREAIGVVG